MKPLYSLTIAEASELLKKGEFTSVELTQACLDRIKEKEPEIHAFITVTPDYALKKAREADKRLKENKDTTPLTGIPYSIKDVYNTKGIQTTAGSKILEGHISQYNATVHQKLEDAGAILVGKTNCDPFGFGSSTEYSAYGSTKNPVNTDYVPGGSSGGSGAAVAYGGGLFSIAEDTGGSIRCPASFCGVVGLKPTYGRVSRYGSIAYASSYDSIGPITKTVKDSAIVLKYTAGKDLHDATTPDVPVPDYPELLKEKPGKFTIGLPKEYYGEGLDREVREIIDSAIEAYKNLGFKTKEVSLPYTKYAIAAYYVIGLSEASSNLARYDGIRYGQKGEDTDWNTYMETVRGESFNEEEKRRIMIGTFALSAGYQDQYYKRAQKLRELLKQDFARVLNEVDFLLTPTMPAPPFKFGENMGDPLKMWLADAFTVSINPVGVPALSVPAGTTEDELPVGMQLIAPHFKEDLLYNVAHLFETS
jgi:aspartyl-tRNA(Asn)/glutamyl-tRNA(Gln) amidotransferase subunit A